MLQVGDSAPDFELLNQNGESIKLSDYRGKPIVVYFYPKALTPGCTVQACGIRDSKNDLAAKGIKVFAVSPDLPNKLKKFEEKHQLNFDLLSDPETETSKAYSVWQLKKFMGKEYMGVVRSTFFINEQGVISSVMDKVKTKTHHTDLLNYYK